jgi:hypothetical protein
MPPNVAGTNGHTETCAAPPVRADGLIELEKAELRMQALPHRTPLLGAVSSPVPPEAGMP